jgi:hypothetical protein
MALLQLMSWQREGGAIPQTLSIIPWMLWLAMMPFVLLTQGIRINETI